MGSRILLISVNRCTHPDPVFPLGLVHLDATLQTAGHTTRWLDFQIDNAEALQTALATFGPDCVGISLRNIDDVLIRRQQTYFDDLAALCQSIRKQSAATIVLGGSGFSIFPRELLEYSGADYGICGAGESSFNQLLAVFPSAKTLETIAGLVFRRENQIRLNPPERTASQTALAEKNYPENLVQHYLKTGGMLNLQTQRGCPFHCCYCTYPLLEGCRPNRRSGEAVAEEMALLQKLGARYAFIVDSVFNSCTRHVHEICEALLKRNLTLEWGCFMRPQGVTEETLALMARAGLRHIEFGTDSFCDEVLERYGKGFCFEDVRNASQLARKLELDYCHFLICGGPGETLQTMQQSFKNSKALPGGIILAVAGMRIYPGTQLHGLAVKCGLVDSATNLLQPQYFIAPGLTSELIFEQLKGFSSESPNWVAGDPSPAYARLVDKLRQRKVAGPLWSYFSMIQRLWPQAPSPQNA